uniref:GAG-pre-integrase domain-containing protein n=1 Tax=Tanacetum cinerariifolium TaxID=118510 RepID=A0A6L2NIX5_TANCI|nr:hypothetical protein [Tanacetum cinerariifolium]
MAANQTINYSIKSILNKEKLNGSNFLDWYRNLRIVLRNEQKLHHLEEALPEAPPTTVTVAVRNAYSRRVAEKQELDCLMLGLRRIQKMNKGALDLYVGNDNRAAVEVIGSFNLTLPSIMVLVLDNCHFAPSITRGVISLSHLWDNCFHHEFMNNGVILVYKDNLFYFNDIPRNGIFEIDIHNHISNERSIYTCSNKKSKHNLDYTFLWHCYLSHINKKHIAKLQHNGLLEPTDDESFDVCISSISRKMVRKPLTHASEKTDDLLGLIHSDVCGPFRTTSKEGANYYITFIDNFSRYSYVYLMKHKHEVFEMFKTFQKEVEDQLGKTIKELRSDRGGYPKETMGYYFYYPIENKIFVARYAEFFESNLISQEASGSTIDFDEIQRQDEQPSDNTSEHQPKDEYDDDDP